MLNWSTELNRVAFTVFGRGFYWYGILIGLAFLVGVCYALWRARTIDFSTDKLIDIVLISTPFAIIGARIYYVIFSLERYDTFAEMIAIWDGGVAFYGALIAGFAVAAVCCHFKKVSIWDVLDIAAPAFLIAQAIGRWGNFMNVEAFGSETTLPWRMEVIVSGVTKYVHPTFLYESLWNVVGFILINLYFKKRKFKGEIFWIYLGWYGLGRAVIEGLRTDSLWWGSVRISQIVAALCVVSAVAVIIMMRRRIQLNTDEKASEQYEPVFHVLATDEGDAGILDTEAEFETEPVPETELAPEEERIAEEEAVADSKAAISEETADSEADAASEEKISE